MNYSKSLPTLTYTTEIGDFKISDVTSYFVLNNINLPTADYDVSSNTTLLELSNTVYSNIDNFWLFLYANNTINPFTLLSPDTVDLLEEYETNTQINTINVSTNANVFVTEGSLLLPYTANAGSTWDYGSTGNFSLTGGFALVKTFNNFTKNATIIQPTGNAVFSINDAVNYIVKGDTYYLKGSFSGITNRIDYLQTQSEATKEIKYKTSGTLQVFGMLDDDLPVNPGGIDYNLQGISQAVSYEEFAKNRDTNIKYFLPYTTNTFNFTQINQNYIV